MLLQMGIRDEMMADRLNGSGRGERSRSAPTRIGLPRKRAIIIESPPFAFFASIAKQLHVYMSRTGVESLNL